MSPRMERPGDADKSVPPFTTPAPQEAGQMRVSVQSRPAPRDNPPKQPRHWNVVLLDDDDHTYEYVIRMMQSLFGHDATRALKIAQSVDAEGRAVCMTTHKEHAELKRDQILAFGRDPLMAVSKGSMTSIIEPVE